MTTVYDPTSSEISGQDSLSLTASVSCVYPLPNAFVQYSKVNCTTCRVDSQNLVGWLY